MRRHRSAKACQCRLGIAGPACNLRAMEVVDGEAAAGVRVSRRLHAVLAVESWEDELADVGARGDQRAKTCTIVPFAA